MLINKFKKIVIKIGSSILIDKKGKPKKIWLKEFVKDIKNLVKKKKQVVIVSSGAIALGCEYLVHTSCEFEGYCCHCCHEFWLTGALAQG